MQEKKSAVTGNGTLSGRFIKFNKTILCIVMFCASVIVVRAVPPVDVKAFGAMGDDIADDRIAIQNAIYSLSSTGGTVYFPPGLYKVSNTIYVPSNIRLEGTGSTYHNTQIRLSQTNRALFEVSDDSASNIVFKDLYMLANSRPNEWPRNSEYETGLIRIENTTAISLKAASRGIDNIVIENVRTSQFTYGISATSSGLGSNNSITDVKIRNYASDGNEYSLHSNTTGATGWDVQNMNVFPMWHDQNGIFLERSGEMRFLQLSCAGYEANICAKLWGNGDTYFRQFHVEGADLGLCVGSNCDGSTGNTGENSSRITLESSATNGEIHRVTDLVSINNRYWLDFPHPAPVPIYKFFSTGVNSTLTSCADVWVSWDPSTHMSNTTVTIPPGVFPGLATTPQGCLNSYLTSVPVFNTGYEPDNERLTNSEVNVTAYGAFPNDSVDDTAAFLAAIAAARVGRGKTVFVPAGIFEVSSTLTLEEGETVLGETGSIIALKTTGISLFKILNGVGTLVHGVTLINLSLVYDSNDPNTGTIGINFENHPSNVIGASSDFMVQNVDFNGFEVGVAVRPVGGVLWNAHPMFDSVSIKDADFYGNNTAILTRSTNASNWSLEDIRVDVGNSKEGVRIDQGAVSIRNLSCTGLGDGKACLTIQRQGVVATDNLSATGVGKALLVSWENGWTQFPVTVRNSDLTEGVYFQGRIYLNSINNIYPASIITSFPKEVKFGAYQEGDPWNVAFGGQSDIFSCDDTFTDLIATQSTWVYSGVLLKPVNYCF